MEEGQCIYELVLDDEQIDSLIIALNDFKRSKNEFEFEVSDDTSIAFYHIDSQPKDKEEDDKEPEEGDDDDEGDWIDNKNVVVSKFPDEDDDEKDDDEGNDDEEEEVVG